MALPALIPVAIILGLRALNKMAEADRAKVLEEMIRHLEDTVQNMQDQSTPPSIADEIAKLGTLLNNGLIIQEEFDAMKRKLIGL